jgi:c-di-GMP phosphodiesterase
MMNNHKPDHDGLSVSIARQPIFDDRGLLWGYEIFCIGSTEIPCPRLPDQPDIGINIESNAYLSLQQAFQGERKIMASFSEKSILDKLPYALPPFLTVMKVCEQVSREIAAMEGLIRLKADGYLVAVRGFSGQPGNEMLYSMADLIIVETGNKEKEALARELALARKFSKVVLAAQVQDRKLYEVCKDLGFSLFHGPFFKLPDRITVRKLSSNEALRLKLLKQIENDKPDLNLLAETIQSDATISFRLLSYLNSAAFAFTRKIKSIHQAITLLGWIRIKNWLRVLLLTDMSPSRNAQELVLLSAQRGKFLELVAREHDFWGFDPESLHLLGIFSLLDALLDLPMTEIVGNLPLDNKMKAALCREPNNEYLPLLHLVQYLEEARWADAETMIRQLNLDSKKVMVAFQNSINWASELDSVHSGISTGEMIAKQPLAPNPGS